MTTGDIKTSCSLGYCPEPREEWVIGGRNDYGSEFGADNGWQKLKRHAHCCTKKDASEAKVCSKPPSGKKQAEVN